MKYINTSCPFTIEKKLIAVLVLSIVDKVIIRFLEILEDSSTALGGSYEWVTWTPYEWVTENELLETEVIVQNVG